MPSTTDLNSSVNVAYTDGALAANGRSGWGVYFPKHPEHIAHGYLRDNRVVILAELHAVLMAVKLAPESQPLRIVTDAKNAVQMVEEGTEWTYGKALVRKIHETSGRRAVPFTLEWRPRSIPELLYAHQLAFAGRERRFTNERKFYGSVVVEPGQNATLQVTALRHTPFTTVESSLEYINASESQEALYVALSVLQPRRNAVIRLLDCASSEQPVKRLVREITMYFRSNKMPLTIAHHTSEESAGPTDH